MTRYRATVATIRSAPVSRSTSGRSSPLGSATSSTSAPAPQLPHRPRRPRGRRPFRPQEVFVTVLGGIAAQIPPEPVVAAWKPGRTAVRRALNLSPPLRPRRGCPSSRRRRSAQSERGMDVVSRSRSSARSSWSPPGPLRCGTRAPTRLPRRRPAPLVWPRQTRWRHMRARPWQHVQQRAHSRGRLRPAPSRTTSSYAAATSSSSMREPVRHASACARGTPGRRQDSSRLGRIAGTCGRYVEAGTHVGVEPRSSLRRSLSGAETRHLPRGRRAQPNLRASRSVS
jgi:hypothetical protein